MDNIRIAILNTYDVLCTYMDNGAPKALHYYYDELHEYLKGSANTYSFKTDARHEDSVFLMEGNKIAFRWREKDYYLNIMSVRRDEFEVEVMAYSLNFELLNEEKEEYKAASALTFAQYLAVFDFEKVVTLGINEVSGKSIKNEWQGTDTMLARLFSLANIFDAEIEFVPLLNDNYSLNKIIMNVYQKHSDGKQGIGQDLTDMVLRYGKNVSGITRTGDISDLCTAIRPVGKDGLTVSSLNKTEYDAEGNVEYTCPAGKRNIYAVQARDRFPSNLMANENERYIAKVWSYDTDNVNVLYGQALAELKKNCIPQVKYEVDGYFDTGIGDTVTVADEEFNPPLYLEARVTEQRRSFTDPSKNKTTFDNFVELQSEIDPSLLAAVNVLIEANKVYTCSIITDNGIIFKNGEGQTTLEASVMNVGKDMTDSLTITWTKNGVSLSTGKTITVKASDINGTAVYKYEAVDSGGTVRGVCEVTVTNVVDGTDGADGHSTYTHIRYAMDALGAGMSDKPDSVGRLTYIGMTTTETSEAPTDPSYYMWSRYIGQDGNDGLDGLQGPEGKQGIQGPAGPDGKTSYTHIAYANSENGQTDFSLSNSNRDYIGMYTDYNVIDSTDPTKYRWSRIVGANGTQGIPGQAGTDGKTPYLHIAYATNATGTAGFSVTDSTDKTYIGQYVDYVTADSTDPTKYKWSKIQGPQGPIGETGADGAPGKDGQNPIVGELSFSPIPLAATSTGTVVSFTDAKGYFRVYDGTTLLDSNVTYSLVSASGITASINSSTGSYAVTAMPQGTDFGTAIFKAVYNGVETQKILSVIKSKQGLKGDTGATGLSGLQGEKGDQGIQGPKGSDGKSSYAHIAYANSNDGKIDFSVSDSNRKYIGMYVDNTEPDSTDPIKYAWSLIKGADGAQGTPGAKGTDGRTPYLHIAYAMSSDGKTGFSTTDSNNKTYIGQYTDYVEADSTDPAKYKWAKIQGPQGEKGATGATGSQGLTGPKGADGTTYYTWLKYADSPTTGMSDAPDGKSYIGLAYNKTTATESTNYSDYTWSLIKGAKGDTGVAGAKGADGHTLYTWVKYGTSSAGAGMSDDPAGKTYIGLAYNKTTPTESTNASDYTWSLIKGEAGAPGANGAKGDPTGITVSATEPTTKYTGMLWKHTGTVSGLVKNALYRWTGTAWELYLFVAENIQATTLSAITTNLGTVNAGNINGVNINGSVFKNTFALNDGVAVSGTTTISDGKVNIDSSYKMGSADVSLSSVLKYDGLNIEWSGAGLGAHYNRITRDGVSTGDALNNVSIQGSGIKLVSGGGSGNALIDTDTFNGKAPNNHASSNSTYGLGSTANYGHVKLANNLTTASYSDGVALSANQGKALNDKIPNLKRGQTAAINVPAGRYTDTAISFSGFSSVPFIFLTFKAGSQNTKYLGLAYLNDTAIGATIRVTNAGTAQYTVFVNWLAIL